MNGSRELLAASAKEDAPQAVVRPWLQDFTASYLEHYIKYGDEQVRQQIQAVYDAGYDQWILWDAGVSYHYGGLLTPEEAEEEDQRISQSRAALETERDAAEKVPAETAPPENAPAETVPPENVPPETVPPAGAAR